MCIFFWRNEEEILKFIQLQQKTIFYLKLGRPVFCFLI